MKKDICPICGTGNLEEKSVTEVFEYKGHSFEVPDYHVLECSNCEESIVSKETLKKTGRVLKDFQREVDGLLKSEDIKHVRKKLHLTQEEMGTILGGGLKAFARYENGQVTQSKIMDNLLRVLEKFPSAIDVINPRYVQSTNVISFFDVKDRFGYRFSGDITLADTDVQLSAIG